MLPCHRLRGQSWRVYKIGAVSACSEAPDCPFIMLACLSPARGLASAPCRVHRFRPLPNRPASCAEGLDTHSPPRRCTVYPPGDPCQRNTDKPNLAASSLPPSLLATLIAALHARPVQPLPLALFTPPLLLSSYLNLAGYPTGAAGLAAAWSGLYALLALRRRQPLRGKLSIRGVVRGAAVGLGTANCVAGGWVYFRGDFNKDEEARLARNRWARKDG